MTIRLIIPRLTTARRTAILTANEVALGEMVFDTDLNASFVASSASDGSIVWEALDETSIQPWSSSTSYVANTPVRVGSTLYVAVQTNSNVNPTGDDGTNWISLGGGGGGGNPQTGAEIITAINGQSSGTIDAARVSPDTTKLDASENIVSGSVNGTTLTLNRQDGQDAVVIENLPSGGQTTTIDATTDGTTITGAGTGQSPLTVVNPFTDEDETKLDGIDDGADVTPSWVPDSDPNYLTGTSAIAAINSQSTGTINAARLTIPADVVRDNDLADRARFTVLGAPIQNVNAGTFMLAGSELYYATAAILNVTETNVATQANALHITDEGDIPADVLRDADFALNAQGQVASINLGGTIRGFAAAGGGGGGDVTLAADQTFTGTNTFTNDRLVLNGQALSTSGPGQLSVGGTALGGSGASADGSSIISTNNVISVSPEIITNAAVGAHTAERLQPAHTVDNSYQLFNGFTDNGSLPDDLQGVSSTFIRPAVEYTRGSRTMIVWFADTTITNAGITSGTELSFLFTGLTSGFRVTGTVVEVDTAERPDETKVGVQFPASSPAIEILEQGTVIPHQRLPGDRIVYGISLFQSEFVDMRSDWTVNYLASSGTLVISLPITDTESALAHTRYRLVTSGGTFVFDGSDVTESEAGRTWTLTRFSTNSATVNIVALASQTLEIGVAEAHQITETTYRAVGYDENNQLQGQEFLEFNQFRPSDLDQIVNRPTVRLGNSAYGEAARFTLAFNGFPQFTYSVSDTLRFADVAGNTGDITSDTTGFFGIANNADIGEVLQFGLVGSSGTPGNTVNRREIYTVIKAGDNRYTVLSIQDFDTHIETVDINTDGLPPVPTTTVASGFAAELRLLTTPRYRRAESYSIGDTVSNLDDDGISRLYVSQQSSNQGNVPGANAAISVTNISVNANQGNRIELVLPQGDRFFDIPTEIYNFAWTNTVGGVATRYSGSILGADIDIGISNQTETLHFEYDATFVSDDLSNLNDKPFPFDLAPTSGTNSDFSFTDSGQHFWAAAGAFGTRQIQEVRAIADSRIARVSPLTLRGLGANRVGTDTFALATSIGGTTLTGVTITDDTNPPRVSFTLTEAATTAFDTELTARGSFNGNPFYILFGTNTDNNALVTFRAENHNFGTQAIISANQTPEFTRWLDTLPDSSFTSSARTTLRYDAFGGVISVATADFGGRVRADVDEDGHPILTVDHNPLVNNVVANQEDWNEIASHITYSPTNNITSGITDGASYDFRVNPVIHTAAAVDAQFSDVWRGGTPNSYMYLGSRRNIAGLAPAGNEVYDVLSYFGGRYTHFDRNGLLSITGEQGRAANPAVTDENGTAQVQLVNLTGGPISIALQSGGSETFQSGQVVSNVRTIVRATGLNQANTAYSTDSASRAIIEIQGVWRSSTNGAQFNQDDIGTHRGLRFQIQTRPAISAVNDFLFGGSSLTANVPTTLSTFDATTGLFRHGTTNTGGSGLSVVRNQSEFDALALSDGLQVMNFGSGNVVVASSGGGTTTVGLGNGNLAAANRPYIRRTENGGGTVYRWNLVSRNAATSTAAARVLNQGETFGPLEYTTTVTPPDQNTVWTTAVTDTGEQINAWKRNINNANDFWNLTTSPTTSAFGTANADNNVITASGGIDDFLDAVLGAGVRPTSSNVQVNSGDADIQPNVYLRIATGGTSSVDTVIVPNQLGVYNMTDDEWRVLTTAVPATA